MRIDGEWFECDDGIVRPIIRGEILSAGGDWESVAFLVDTGADRTVLSASVTRTLGYQLTGPRQQLGGVGGLADSVIVSTQIRLQRENCMNVHVRGQYAALTRLEDLDLSVLGRDVLDLFAVVVDRRQNVVTLIGQKHRYRIEST